MPFQVFIQRFLDEEPQAVSGNISAKSAIRLMGSLIRGKRWDPAICRVYAVGQRFGWIYSQRDLMNLVRDIKAPRLADQNLPAIPI